MSNSVNEDREQLEKISMEDSQEMTINFLRARLLSERSVSKTARQRADELSKRVVELEEQLKFISIMRKKAEKATADVLAILENHGISDASEGLDPNSDQDENPPEVNDDKSTKENLTKLKARRNEMEAYYSSELESSPSTGRSLSWKSTKDCQYSFEKKNYLESFRRRNNFALNSSSPKRAGKSCRRIRRRETRAIDEFRNDDPVKISFSRDASNCFDGEFGALSENTKFENGKKLVEDNPRKESDCKCPKIDDHYIRELERDEDMESALQHQAQLIGQFEEEEKAQRAWEEKYREKNNGTQDSCEPGNHSDVTEERDEIKFHEVINNAGILSIHNQKMKGKLVDTAFDEELQASKTLPLKDNIENGFLQDQRLSGKITCEPNTTELSFPLSTGNNDQDPLLLTPANPSSEISSFAEKSTLSAISPSISTALELAVVRPETSLGSVLEALQIARSALQKKLDPSLAVEGVNGNTCDAFKVHAGSPALFRMLTDDQFKETTVANHPDISPSSSSSYFPYQISGGNFFAKPYMEHRVTSSSINPEVRPPVVHHRSLSQPWLGAGTPSYSQINHADPHTSMAQPWLDAGTPSYSQINHIDPHTSMAQPSAKDSFQFFPNITRQSLLPEGALRTFSRSETNLSPVAHFSSYNDHHRPYNR